MDIEKLIEKTIAEIFGQPLRWAHAEEVRVRKHLRAAFAAVRRAAIEECAGHLRDHSNPGHASFMLRKLLPPAAEEREVKSKAAPAVSAGECEDCGGAGKHWRMGSDNTDIDEWDCEYCRGTGKVAS